MTDAARRSLLDLLNTNPRGSANQQDGDVRHWIQELEAAQPADLTRPATLELLEGVWELRWSSGRQLYLQATPWLENLQVLKPSAGRAMNLLRPAGIVGPLAAISVEARIEVSSPQRVEVRFFRGGWLGPTLGSAQLRLLRTVRQAAPAWLDITVLDRELRVCRGSAGTLFALVRRPELRCDDLLPAVAP